LYTQVNRVCNSNEFYLEQCQGVFFVSTQGEWDDSNVQALSNSQPSVPIPCAPIGRSAPRSPQFSKQGLGVLEIGGAKPSVNHS
jgi:hypothetical protein